VGLFKDVDFCFNHQISCQKSACFTTWIAPSCWKSVWFSTWTY